MILQALASYYDRSVGLPDGPPAFGYTELPVVAALVLDSRGRLAPELMDLREMAVRGKAQKAVPRRMVVPQPPIRTSGIAAGFLCDNAGYLLGFGAVEKAKRARQQFEASRETHKAILGHVSHPAARAILDFYSDWNPDKAPSYMAAHPDEFASGWLVFYYGPSAAFVHEIQEIRTAWEEREISADAPRAQCLITGETDVPIVLTHPAIKGILGAQSSGAALVSFNQESFTSYGKGQNLNAPVGERAAFAYTTALNHLARRDSNHKFVLGDTTVLVWADKATPAEATFIRVLGGFSDRQEAKHTGLEALEAREASGEAREDDAVASVGDKLKRIAAGKWATDPELGPAAGIRFYVLGLAPNASRLQVRFFEVDTLGHLLERMQLHCRDVLFEAPEEARFIPSLLFLARETLPKDRDGRIRTDRSAQASVQRLFGDLLRAILSGHGYPQSLLLVLLDRLRSDRKVTDGRLGLIKACINAEQRRTNMDRRRIGVRELSEIPMTVDEQITEPGYVLGRVFAVLQSMQEVSRGPGGRDQPTIADRFLGAAAATPRSIFSHLLDLERAHERKAKREKAGLAHSLARRLAELMARIDGASGFPVHLDPHQQGLFYIGYYHGRQARFSGRKPDESDQPEDDALIKE
jgi:CRISPR-associated protein Csd1